MPQQVHHKHLLRFYHSETDTSTHAQTQILSTFKMTHATTEMVQWRLESSTPTCHSTHVCKWKGTLCARLFLSSMILTSLQDLSAGSTNQSCFCILLLPYFHLKNKICLSQQSVKIQINSAPFLCSPIWVTVHVVFLLELAEVILRRMSWCTSYYNLSTHEDPQVMCGVTLSTHDTSDFSVNAQHTQWHGLTRWCTPRPPAGSGGTPPRLSCSSRAPGAGSHTQRRSRKWHLWFVSSSSFIG